LQATLLALRARRGDGGDIAATAVKAFFDGKDPLFREQLWQDFRTYDRWWNQRTDLFLRTV